MSEADLTDEEFAELERAITQERQRELAVEHLLFQTLAFIESRNQGLLDHLEFSLAHLGDSADDETKDDEAVREVARKIIRSVRKGGG